MATTSIKLTQGDANEVAEKVRIKVQAMLSGPVSCDAAFDQMADLLTISIVRQFEATRALSIVVLTPKTWLHALAHTLSFLPLLRWIPVRYHRIKYRLYEAVSPDSPERFLLVRDYTDGDK